MNTTETALNILIEKLTAIEKEVKKTPTSNQDVDVLKDLLNSINTQNKKDFEQIKLLLNTKKKPPKRPLFWNVLNTITAAAVIALAYFQFLAIDKPNYNSQILARDKDDLILTNLTYMYLSENKQVFTTSEFNAQKQRFLKSGKRKYIKLYHSFKMKETEQKLGFVPDNKAKTNQKNSYE